MLRITLLLFVFGLALAASRPYHSEPHHLLLDSILMELKQVKHTLRTTELKLAQQQAATDNLHKTPEIPPRATPTAAHPHPSAQAAPCASCSLIKSLALVGLIGALARASTTHRECAPCGPHVTHRLTNPFTIGTVLAITALSAGSLLLVQVLHLVGYLIGTLAVYALPITIMLAPFLFQSRCGLNRAIARRGILPSTLSDGSVGPAVAQLQHTLIALGYLKPGAIRYRAGFYGPRTRQAVSELQVAMGVQVTGQCDDSVKRQLEIEIGKLANQPTEAPTETTPVFDHAANKHETSDKQEPSAANKHETSDKQEPSAANKHETSDKQEPSAAIILQPRASFVGPGFAQDLPEALQATDGSLEREDMHWLLVPGLNEWGPMLEQLKEMGFTEQLAIDALQEAQGNVKLAVKLLVKAERARA